MTTQQQQPNWRQQYEARADEVCRELKRQQVEETRQFKQAQKCR
jgi:ABC-type Zn uptake system ZnuABC Zn-binding protein ZnuA